mmetsp:Transcript_44371/g.71330  ORF Transcript_44371/g.71330 Transcript_44371/m.71330 type:complete len:251 (-) Transcript_44371:73-825(-)
MHKQARTHPLASWFIIQCSINSILFTKTMRLRRTTILCFLHPFPKLWCWANTHSKTQHTHASKPTQLYTVQIFLCPNFSPSGGHDMVVLDYRKCGRKMEKGFEPSVVHIDQEFNFKRTFLAKDFATFIKGLKSENDADDLREQRKKKAEKKKGKKRGRSNENGKDKADSSSNRKRGKKDDSPESNVDIIEELERQGAAEINKFKQKAYINAAKALKRCKKAITSSKDIAHYKGIGKSAKILIDEVIAGRD